MNGTIILWAVALTLRASGAAARIGKSRLPLRFLGWFLCMIAAWATAGAAGAWSSLWPALGLGALGALGDSWRNRYAGWIAADVAAVMLSGLLSIPSMRFGQLTAYALTFAGVGFGVDLLLVRCRKEVRVGILALPFVCTIALGMVKHSVLIRSEPLLWEAELYKVLPFLGLTPVYTGERIVLKTGAVAWFEQPHGQGPFPSVLFFHGAHPAASHQAAAIVVRRALLEAGFAVLSVDHPGYGQSPKPDLHAEIDAWDPLPTALSALDILRAKPGISGIAVLGHSMGCTQVLQLLNVEPQLRWAVLMGAAGDPSKTSTISEYWYRRFHTDRRMRSYLPAEQYHEIRQRFYDTYRLAQQLPREHPPILYIRFGQEWPNIVATRDILYAAIPGHKRVWDLVDSTHYFNSVMVFGLVIGDTRVTHALASELRLLKLENADAPNTESSVRPNRLVKNLLASYSD